MDVSEEQIIELVDSFYKSARADEDLGPLFNATISDWEHHLLTVVDFWSHVLLRTNRYHRHPFPAHMHLPIKLAHFDRWLALFNTAADETLPPDAAQKAKARAAHMTESFRVGIFPFIGADGQPSRIPARSTSVKAK
jgi:hemoglobin